MEQEFSSPGNHRQQLDVGYQAYVLVNEYFSNAGGVSIGALRMQTKLKINHTTYHIPYLLHIVLQFPMSRPP